MWSELQQWWLRSSWKIFQPDIAFKLEHLQSSSSRRGKRLEEEQADLSSKIPSHTPHYHLSCFCSTFQSVISSSHDKSGRNCNCWAAVKLKQTWRDCNSASSAVLAASLETFWVFSQTPAGLWSQDRCKMMVQAVNVYIIELYIPVLFCTHTLSCASSCSSDIFMHMILDWAVHGWFLGVKFIRHANSFPLCFIMMTL